MNLNIKTSEDIRNDILKKTLGKFYKAPTQDLTPYIEEVKQEKSLASKIIQPLQMAFQIISAGQYLSANIVDEVIHSAETNTELPEHISNVLSNTYNDMFKSGEKKGDFEKILREHGSPEMKNKLLPESMRKVPIVGQMDMASVLGFLGNVVLDPTTYVGGPLKWLKGGSISNVSKKAANEFAKDMVISTVKKDLTENIGGKLGTNLDEQALSQLSKIKTQKEALNVLGHYKGNASRYLENVYNTAYKEALKTPTEVLQKRMTDWLAPEGGQVIDELMPIVQKLRDKTAYSGAGQRAMADVFGKELGVREVYTPFSKFMDTTKSYLSTYKPIKQGAEYMGKAIYGFMNESSVGKVLKHIGVRNPYQKMLRLEEMNAKKTEKFYQGLYTKPINELRSFSPDVSKAFTRLNDWAEKDFAKSAGEGIKQTSAMDILDSIRKGQVPLDITGKPINIQGIIGNIDIKKIDEYAIKINKIRTDWNLRMQSLAGQGIIDEAGQIVNYLPNRYKESGVGAGVMKETGTQSPSFTKSRYVPRADVQAEELKKIKYIYGLDKAPNGDQIAMDILDTFNASNVEMDMNKLLLQRGFAMAKLEKRAQLIEQFKQFGIKSDELPQEVGQVMSQYNRALPELGLYSIGGEKALQGYLFDKDVSEILGRATQISSPSWVDSVNKILAPFTSWIRGIYTFSPGFHIRNMQGNAVTQWIKHGADALNPKTISDGIAGTMYMIKQTNPQSNLNKLFSAMNIDESWVNNRLNSAYGNMTLKELADESIKNGVFSESSMASGAEEMLQKFEKGSMNPFNRKFVPVQMSREIGTLVENSARFQSFIMDYNKVAQKNIGENLQSMRPDRMLEEITAKDKAALDWASTESKKWFMDYEDLTEFEQKIMRNIIPFYCVPDNSEILTSKGWKSVYELGVNEKVLTYNINTNSGEWSNLNGYRTFYHDQELYCIGGKRGGILCTDEHKWVIKENISKFKGKTYGGGIKLLPTNKLKTNHSIVMCMDNIAFPIKSILTPEQAELLGWIITDGYFRFKGNYCESLIYQHPKKFLEIVKKVAGGKPRKAHPDSGVVAVPVLKEKLIPLLDILKYKNYSDVIPQLSREACEKMFHAMYLADGTVSLKRGNRDTLFLASTKPEVLKAFTTLCFMLGYRTRESNRGTYISLRSTIKLSGAIKREKYTGIVWCPNTDNGTWVMRQNGIITITGNTWIRKNIGNQLTALATYPQRYAMFPKLLEMVDYDFPEFDPSVVPEYMKELGMVPVGQGDGGTEMYNPNLPFQDINKLPLQFMENQGKVLQYFNPETIVQEFVSASHPIIKLGMSLITKNGYNAFYREETGSTSKAPLLFRFLVSKPEVLGIVDGVGKTLGLDNWLKLKIDDSGKLKMDSHVVHILDTFLPILRQLDMAYYAAANIPGVEQAIQKATNAKDDFDKMEQFFQTLSFYGGVKFKNIDLEAEKEKQNLEIYNQARYRASRDKPRDEVRRYKQEMQREKQMRRYF